MNGRELHESIYAGAKVERIPICGIGGWAESIARWRREGLGPDQNPNEALGLVADERMGLPLNINMHPPFPIRILNREDRYVTLVDEYGVTKKMLRSDFDRSDGRKGAAGATSSMSLWIDFPVKDMRSWKALYEERFQASPEGRIPRDWKHQKPSFQERSATRWVGHFSFPFGGLFSAIRELMGAEKMFLAMFDCPELVRTIVSDLSAFYLACFGLLLPEVRCDQVTCFEDMCSTTRPMVSPAMFRSFFAPGYRTYIGGLKELGVKQVFIDTDGDARLIIPELIACGFTGTAPCEVNAGMDAAELRRAYPEFCLSGGIDKRAVAKGGDALEREFSRRFRTAWDLGRYTPCLDHGAPPDISWPNMLDYARMFLAWRQSPDGH